MIFGVKDIIKLFAISVICFCAVFVGTFFLNFYLDLSALENITDNIKPIYDAQLATAQLTSAACVGFLGVITVIMLVFYIRSYVKTHTVQLGILKAMGYSDGEIALRFWAFGLPVLFGAGLGYGLGHILMPYIYGKLLIGGLPNVNITFHVGLLFALVIGPTVVYSLLSCTIAYFSLNAPVRELLCGKSDIIKKPSKNREMERPFLKEMFFRCVSTKKLLVFFVSFGAFCFSAMVQMSVSVRKDMAAEDMANILLMIGITVAVVAMLISVSSLVSANAENVSVMKACGYSLRECAVTVFGGCVPFAFLGFAVGTVYQFGMLSIMVKLIYRNMDNIPEYSFDLPLMFITLALFIAFTAIIFGFYILRLNKISVKQASNE